MNNAIKKPLGEVADIIMGQSPESESYNDKGDGITFYQGKSDFGAIHPTVRMHCNSPKKIAIANDILMSVRAPIGDVNIAQDKCCIGRGLAAIRPNGNTNLKYLFYLLDYYKERLAERGTGSTFKAIGKDILNEFPIPVWAAATQQNIANVVDDIQSLIFNRQKAHSLLDELVKSRFVEMFGDPVTNPMGWELVTLGDAVKVKPQNGLYKPQSDYVTNSLGTPILRIDAFYDGRVKNFAELKRLNCTDEEIQKYLLQEDDIVINRVNSLEYLGKCAHITGLLENTVYESNMMRFHMQDGYNPIYTTHLLCSPYMKKQIKGCAKQAVNQASINQQDVQSFTILKPPIAIQNQFADFVALTDKSKLAVQKSIEVLQTLKASLMQEYFG